MKKPWKLISFVPVLVGAWLGACAANTPERTANGDEGAKRDAATDDVRVVPAKRDADVGVRNDSEAGPRVPAMDPPGPAQTAEISGIDPEPSKPSTSKHDSGAGAGGMPAMVVVEPPQADAGDASASDGGADSGARDARAGDALDAGPLDARAVDAHVFHDVDTGPPEPEAAPDPCEVECTAAGGICVGGVACLFECVSPGDCDFDIVCPDGFDCTIHCDATGSCPGTVECPESGADRCDVRCGQDACMGGVRCGGKACDVTCGPGSCGGEGIGGGADELVVECQGEGSCTGGIECNARYCDIDCAGDGSCVDGNIAMNAVSGNLRCSGAESCEGPVYCSASSCNVSCPGDGACAYCDGRQYCP